MANVATSHFVRISSIRQETVLEVSLPLDLDRPGFDI